MQNHVVFQKYSFLFKDCMDTMVSTVRAAMHPEASRMFLQCIQPPEGRQKTACFWIFIFVRKNVAIVVIMNNKSLGIEEQILSFINNKGLSIEDMYSFCVKEMRKVLMVKRITI